MLLRTFQKCIFLYQGVTLFNIFVILTNSCSFLFINHLNAELNPICHLLALVGGATIVVVSRLRVNYPFPAYTCICCYQS